MSITLNNRYEIDTSKYINKGTYSIVFYCKDKDNEQLQLAAKVISDDSENNTKSIQEYQILNSLQDFQNPHIVKCYDIGKHEGKIIIIMEYCELGDLSKKINEMKQQNQRFTAEQILDFIYQIVDGAYLLYQNNIFHRDMKPQNILLTRDFEQNLLCKICDFGSARLVQDMGLKQDFTKFCTPQYQSPEIYKKQLFSPQSDIFSFGLIIYELCLLKYPYNNSERESFFEQLKNKPFEIDLSTIEGNEEQINFIKLILEQTIVYDQESRFNWQFLHDLITEFKQNSQATYEQQNKDNSCYTIAKQHVNLLISKLQLANALMLQFQLCFNNQQLDISIDIFKLAFTTLACCKHILGMSIISFMECNYKTLSSNLKEIINKEMFQQLSAIYKQKFKQDPDNNFNFDDFDIKKFDYALGVIIFQTFQQMAKLQIIWINDLNKSYQNQFKDLNNHFIQFTAFANNIGISQSYGDYICLWNDLFENQIKPKIPYNNQHEDLIIFQSFKFKFQHKRSILPSKELQLDPEFT
ncbi:unnamed protein product (macronuclear) [Paramecium tetraurelia]|uniref:Protein kinase domain-containing protein n=1 Tax=Paramecium tetraurelia TaxID=5888 RepID=A0DM05_PARTE|nr:uncharacterized protein GSPATT00018290001 [Paramecium tetraurelia]CAK84072.1 unnamed protein product [Paramecium tetraurelia]|eukprot:XP_001451469.1 hypothetical protein (macronuclear) [Paramecium tetraurelia strain d4-2]